MSELTSQAPALIGIGAQSIVDRAKSLGLTWTLRPGTVIAPPVQDPTGTQVVFDGDTDAGSIGAINLTGSALAIGTRVMGMFVPPAGTYVVGTITLGTNSPNTAGITTVSGGTDSLTSTTYVDMAGGGVVSFDFTKEATSTQIRIDMSATAQAGSSNPFVTFGVRIGSTSYDVFQNYYAVTTRLPGSGTNVITSGLLPGLYTIHCQWKLRSAGTVTRFGGDDYLSCYATEVRVRP